MNTKLHTTFAAAAFTLLTAAGAHAQSVCEDAPSAIQRCGQPLGQLGAVEGIFRASDQGDSDCHCYVRQDGAFAIGQFSGGWYLLNQGSCDTSQQPMAVYLGAANSCDPTNIGGLSEAPPDIDVVVNSASQLGDNRGDYGPMACGDSEASCFAHEDGTFAIGFFIGSWYLLNQGDCDIDANTMAIHLGGSSSAPENIPTANIDPEPVPDFCPGAPPAVQSCGQPIGQLGDVEGIFRASKQDDSDCNCYVREDGAFAIGQFSGGWYLLDQDSCDTSLMPMAYYMGAANSCDPTNVPGLTVAPPDLDMHQDYGSQLGDSRGPYGPMACGDSTVSCFVQDSGTFSIGYFSGGWYLLNQTDCNVDSSTMAITLSSPSPDVTTIAGTTLLPFTW